MTNELMPLIKEKIAEGLMRMASDSFAHNCYMLLNTRFSRSMHTDFLNSDFTFFNYP